MNVVAIVPILPSLASLAWVLPALLLALWATLSSLRHPAVLRQIPKLLWRQKLVLSVVVLGVAASVWLSRVGPGSGATVPDEELVAGVDWPMDRGGLARRGWVPGEPCPERAAAVWSSGLPGESFLASPAVVGNRVYCVGSRGDTGLISCWDAATGRRLWNAAPRGYRATFSSPVVAGPYLLCGEGLHHARMARVVCVGLQPPHVGQVRWTFQTNGHVECTPVVDGDRVYVGAGDDGIYCLRLDPELPETQRLAWHAPADRYPDAETALAVWGGRVYAGLGLGGNALCVLDAQTGAEVTRIVVPYPVFSPPAIDGGKLFVGMGQGDGVRPVENPAGCVCCFDLATLREEWRFTTPATVLRAVAVAGDELVVGCTDGRVYVLDRGGQLLRRWDSRSAIVAAPAVTDEGIYVVNENGWLTALERRGLQPLWEQRLGRPAWYFSAPVVAHGRVFVGTEHDGLRCVGEPLPEAGRTVWPGPWGGAGFAGCRDRSPLASAKTCWELARQPGREAAWQITAPVAVAAGAIVAPFVAGEESGWACLETNNGLPRVRWVHPATLPIVSTPAIAGGRVVAVAGRDSDARRELTVLDLASGQLLWSEPTETLSQVLTATGDRLFVQDPAGQLTSRSLTGERQWSVACGPMQHAVDAATAVLIAAAEEPPRLLALDCPTGRLLWSCALGSPAVAAPALRGGRVHVADRTGLQARSLLDGRGLWRTGLAVGGPVYVGADVYAYVSATGELIIGDARTGMTSARIAGAVLGANPLAAGQEFLFAGPAGILRVGLDGQRLRCAAPLSGDQITAAPVLDRGRLYLGLAGRGLVCLGEQEAR